MSLSTAAKTWARAALSCPVVNTVMTRCTHAHWQGSSRYLAFYVKPLCRISASCWMQVGCETYLLQPRCACNPSLSPLPPPCSGGCLEHRPQVCPCLWMWPLACMFVCLSLFSCKCLLSLNVSHFSWCIYCIFTHMCTVLLFLSPPLPGSSLSFCLQAADNNIKSVINTLFKVVYILMSAIYMIIFTYFCVAP